MADPAARQGRAHAMVAEFPTAAALYHVAEKLRDKGFLRWDVFSPFPIHGMDQAMGLKKSPLGYFVFFGGLTGAITGFCLQVIPSAVLYPLIVQGKPFISLPAFFPIIFELTILISAFTAVIGMCVFNRLPRLHHPLFSHEDFKRVTDDAFFVAIETSDPQFHEKETRRILEEAGGKNISIVRDDP